jgi:hypothetical protein
MGCGGEDEKEENRGQELAKVQLGDNNTMPPAVPAVAPSLYEIISGCGEAKRLPIAQFSLMFLRHDLLVRIM